MVEHSQNGMFLEEMDSSVPEFSFSEVLVLVHLHLKSLAYNQRYGAIDP